MRFYRCAFCLLALTSLVLIPNRDFCTPRVIANNQQTDSDVEMLRKAEHDIQLLDSQKLRKDIVIVARRAEKQLKSLLQRYPNTSLRDRVETNLKRVQEFLGMFNLRVARLYFSQGFMKGMESRLLTVTREYPKFSHMDEVLLLLGKVYMKWEQPEEAVNHLRRLVCNYPNSKYVSEAVEQLNQIGGKASEDCDTVQPQ